jgi:hypothetical protein
MANRRRWAALRYARLIAEVKRDTEVASAVEIGASDDVSRIANGDVVSVSNTQFQGYVSNTNSRLTTLESDISGQASNAFITSTFTSNTDFQAFVSNTNLRITAVEDESYSVQLNQAGDLEITTGTVRWYSPQAITVNSIKSIVGTSPVGASLEVTVNKNGSPLNNLSISAGATSDENTGLSLSVAEDDYLTVDITQIGSSTSGSDLNVIIEYTKD